MALTQKQKLLAVSRGERLEKLPFGARIDIWYNYHLAHESLPEKYKGWSMSEVARDQGAGVQKRFFSVVREEYQDVDLQITKDGDHERREYKTPRGNVYKELQWTTHEGSWLPYEVSKLFKSAEDYPAIIYLMEHTVPAPDFEAYNKVCNEIGEDGQVMSGIGLWSPMHRIMREIIGYVAFFYELADHPEELEELHGAVKRLERKKYEVAAQSDHELFHVCGNWSDEIHTPVFEQYIVPWLEEIGEFLHARGKLAMIHGDGEMKRMLPLMKNLGMDVFEGITPQPQTSMTMREFREAIGEDVTIWGGIPSVLFEPTYSDKEFESFVVGILREMAPGHRFIVGMGDNLPVSADVNRVGKVAELIQEFGGVP